MNNGNVVGDSPNYDIGDNMNNISYRCLCGIRQTCNCMLLTYPPYEYPFTPSTVVAESATYEDYYIKKYQDNKYGIVSLTKPDDNISIPHEDKVNHPSHYKGNKFEVIDIIEDFELGFSLGNAIKYILRAGDKDPTKYVEDLEKAIWYIKREIKNHA
jgi:hypothetical protein